MTIEALTRLLLRGAKRPAAAALCLALWAVGPSGARAGPDSVAMPLRQGAYPSRSADQARTWKHAEPPVHLHFLEPSQGAAARIGDLRMKVAPPAAGGRTVEVLLAWNSDPRGVIPVETCRIPLDQLVSGVLLPASATQGHLGSFTIQARVVEPYQGPSSAPVDVTLRAADGADGRALRRAPTYEELPSRPRADPVGDFACIH